MKSVLFNFTSGPMAELVSNFLSALPKIISAIVIAIIGFIIAKIVSRIVKTFLEKIQIDKLGEKLNEIEIIDKSNIKIKFSAALSKVAYYLLLIFFLVMATDVLAMPAISNLVVGIFNLIPNLLVAVIILVLGILISDGIKKMVQTALESLGIPSAKMISTFLFYFLFINVLLLALGQAGIDTDFLGQNISIIIAGIILAFAIGYGLASRSTMSNFLASFYSKGKIGLGDKITMDGVTGEIIALDKSTLLIKTSQNNTVVFPLHKITTEKIEIHN